MATFTSNGTGGGSWRTPATWTAGSGYPQTGDSVIIVNGDTVTIDSGSGEACFDCDIQSGGVLSFSCLLAAQTLTFDDTASAGFKSSAGTLILSGTATYTATITSAGGDTPTNYWDFYCTTLSVTATYGVFNAYSKTEFQAGSTINITNSTFSNAASGSGAYAVYFNGATLTAFNDNTISDAAGDGALLCNTTHVFDNIVITNPSGWDIKTAASCDVHLTNSNFDASNCAVGNALGATLSSEDHNDTAGDFVIILRATPETDFSELANEHDPSAPDDIYLYLEADSCTSATFDFDEASKTFGSLNNNTGEAITVKVSALTIIFKGGFAEAYILNVTATGNCKFDASTAGANADIEIEFQSNANAEIDVDSGGKLTFNGDKNNIVTISEKGVTDSDAPTNGIGIANVQGTWALFYTKFYHIRDGKFEKLCKSVEFQCENSEVWFEVSSPVEVIDLNLSAPVAGWAFSVFSSYDDAQWTFRVINTLTPGYDVLFYNLMPSIWKSSTDGMVFWQMPRDVDETLPSIMEGKDSSSYHGGDNITTERSHITDSLFTVEGILTAALVAGDETYLDADYPMGHRKYIARLKRWYLAEETDLEFCWQEGLANDCQIVEFTRRRLTGKDKTVPYTYNLVIKGEAAVSP